MSPETKLTAQETKEAVLWVAKEMLRTNLVEGTAGNLGARLPDVVGRLHGDDAR